MMDVYENKKPQTHTRFKNGQIVYIKSKYWASLIGRYAKVIEAHYESGRCKSVLLKQINGESSLFSPLKIRLATKEEITYLNHPLF